MGGVNNHIQQSIGKKQVGKKMKCTGRTCGLYREEGTDDYMVTQSAGGFSQ